MKRIFIIPLILIILFIIGMLVALLSHVSSAEMIRAVSSADTLFALRLSLITSLMAICNSVLLALPSAYLMARCNFFGKAAVDVLLDLPLVMPPLVAGVGLLFLFGEPLLNKALAQLGLHLIFTRWGAVAAQTFIAAPILTRSCRAAFEAVNPRYELAGRTLGLSGFQVFFIITLPMARQGILAGMILAWARALGEFGATLMVAGATRFKTATLPISVYLNISSGEVGLALACSWLLIMTGVILLITIKWIGRGKNSKVIAGGL